MKLTIKEYCEKKGIGVRYIQRMIKNMQCKLLADNWGIVGYTRVGNTYLLDIKENYF